MEQYSSGLLGFGLRPLNSEGDGVPDDSEPSAELVLPSVGCATPTTFMLLDSGVDAAFFKAFTEISQSVRQY